MLTLLLACRARAPCAGFDVTDAWAKRFSGNWQAKLLLAGNTLAGGLYYARVCYDVVGQQLQ